MRQGYTFSISSITQYEIYSGANLTQSDYWQDFVRHTQILSFDKEAAKIAIDINNSLKRKRKQIDVADLFIAATAISNDLPFATLNLKHFERIDALQIIG